MRPAEPELPGNELLTPREVAQIFGVRPTTIARWARQGELAFHLTPGGHRRYRAAAVRALVKAREAPSSREREQWERDAARLYDQGWSIRQVAEKFDCGYSAMRRVLLRRTKLRQN